MGYIGYSMSENAANAYGNGNKPWSKWTKAEILEELQKNNKDEKILEVAKKIPVEKLKSEFLNYSEWHHTSSWYNCTDFYSFDEEKAEEITLEEIQEIYRIAKEEKETQKKEIQKEEKYKCKYLTWSGSRNYPRATEHIDVGIIKGNWFYLPDGTKKSINANGFCILEKIEE